jgi:diguanylate cyclase (GGDEF)-like protein
MPETATSETRWRLDRIEAGADSNRNDDTSEGQEGRDARQIVSSAVTAETRSRSADVAPGWNQTLRTWLSSRFDRRSREDAGFEELIHHFAATLEGADDASVVEAALLRLARELAPASRIELVPVPASAVDDSVADASSRGDGSADTCTGGGLVVDVPLRCGGPVGGMLRVRPRTERCSPLKPETIRRLTTICTIAACAMETVGQHVQWPRDNGQRPGNLRTGRAAVQFSEISDPRHRSILLHDATFLNAVLPFALNQARRHRESLSLLCVAIDRLSGIQELLGHAAVHRLVRHVGETVGSLIRDSDIVAVLDDDRVVAVLPRAPRGGALHVAERMCRTIAERTPADCEAPRVTVSIGVATFPSCALDVYSLFDAADLALAWAEHNGRNQAMLAPPLRAPAREPVGGST